MIPETDQWLLDGDCKKCRKMEYCSKACKATKVAMQKEISRILQKMREAKKDAEPKVEEEN